jgi:phospholipid/cholesterol/gamma-HCH transport system permease protein
MAAGTSVADAAKARKTEQGALVIELSGDWTLADKRPGRDQVLSAIDEAGGNVSFDTRELGKWDSRLLTFLIAVDAAARERGLEVDASGLPEGARKLLALAEVVPERQTPRRDDTEPSMVARLGANVRGGLVGAVGFTGFLGEACVALVRLLTGRARMRRGDLLLVMQRTGPEALPIVCLISALVGLILAFVAAVQLSVFGAQIYVASLVGIAMVRVMGAVMTGVIMAGRTGAAFAAEIGSMQANEEVDALRTLGISPMEFLVLPRMLGLSLMMPLLCVFADALGILGGWTVGVFLLGLNPSQYIETTREAVEMKEVWIGLVHGFVFGVLVALTGCHQGMQAGRSAASVGLATTAAVVNAIVSIVVATAVITVICNALGI